MEETTKLRKGNTIHFIAAGRIETITRVKGLNDSVNGELATDKNEYSIYFIRTWQQLGFLKIYKKEKNEEHKTGL